MLVVSYSMLVCLSFLDNHDFVLFCFFCFIFCFCFFVGVVVVICCCMLRIVFISWQTVVCLLNSTALSPGDGEIPHRAIPEFKGVCRLHLSAG